MKERIGNIISFLLDICFGMKGIIVNIMCFILGVFFLLVVFPLTFASINQIRNNMNEVPQSNVKVYTAEGYMLADYEGNINIDSDEEGYIKFDYDGKRYVYYNCFVETIEEIK